MKKLLALLLAALMLLSLVPAMAEEAPITISLYYSDNSTLPFRADWPALKAIQEKYNAEHGVTPVSVKKAVRDLIEIGKKEAPKKGEHRRMSAEEREKTVAELTAEMKRAASRLEFERAAYLRDKIKELRDNQ